MGRHKKKSQAQKKKLNGTMTAALGSPQLSTETHTRLVSSYHDIVQQLSIPAVIPPPTLHVGEQEEEPRQTPPPGGPEISIETQAVSFPRAAKAPPSGLVVQEMSSSHSPKSSSSALEYVPYSPSSASSVFCDAISPMSVSSAISINTWLNAYLSEPDPADLEAVALELWIRKDTSVASKILRLIELDISKLSLSKNHFNPTESQALRWMHTLLLFFVNNAQPLSQEAQAGCSRILAGVKKLLKKNRHGFSPVIFYLNLLKQVLLRLEHPENFSDLYTAFKKDLKGVHSFENFLSFFKKWSDKNRNLCLDFNYEKLLFLEEYLLTVDKPASEPTPSFFYGEQLFSGLRGPLFDEWVSFLKQCAPQSQDSLFYAGSLELLSYWTRQKLIGRDRFSSISSLFKHYLFSKAASFREDVSWATTATAAWAIEQILRAELVRGVRAKLVRDSLIPWMMDMIDRLESKSVAREAEFFRTMLSRLGVEIMPLESFVHGDPQHKQVKRGKKSLRAQLVPLLASAQKPKLRSLSNPMSNPITLSLTASTSNASAQAISRRLLEYVQEDCLSQQDLAYDCKDQGGPGHHKPLG